MLLVLILLSTVLSYVESNARHESFAGKAHHEIFSGIVEDPATCLRDANSYRQRHHGTPLLVWDGELASKAQAYAQLLLRETLTRGKLYFEHDPANQVDPKMGENLWHANGWPDGDLRFYCDRADKSWYSEIQDWDFKTSARRAGSRGQIGHFTQMVWARTTKVGYGYAIAESPNFKPRKIVFVVAKYRQPGNHPGKFQENVKPLKGVVPITMQPTKVTVQPTEPVTRPNTSPATVATTTVPTTTPGTDPTESSTEPTDPTEPGTEPTAPTEAPETTTISPTTPGAEPTTSPALTTKKSTTIRTTAEIKQTGSRVPSTTESMTIGVTTNATVAPERTKPTVTSTVAPTATSTVSTVKRTVTSTITSTVALTATPEVTRTVTRTVKPTDETTAPSVVTTTAVATEPTTEPPIPPAEFSCDFERDMCNMTILGEGQPSWRPSWNRVDKAAYMIQDRVSERGLFLISRHYVTKPLRTPEFVGGPQTLQFYYVGLKGILKVELVGGLESKVVMSLKAGEVSSAHPPRWKQAIKSYQPPHIPYYFQFSLSTGGSFALDDISLLPSSNTDLPSPSLVSCGFHSRAYPFCSWTRTGDFNWTTSSRNTPSLYTGPKRPVTGLAHGVYAYAEASFPRKQGDKALLRSPLLESSTPHCMVLFTNTQGVPEEVGHLSMKMDAYHPGGNRTSWLRDLSVSEGEGIGADGWTVHHIDLPAGLLLMELIATVGAGPNSDVAVDNMVVLPGVCNPKYAESIQCDFEDEELCQQDLKMKLNGFQITNGSIPKPREGIRIHICEYSRPNDEWLYCAEPGQVIKIIGAVWGRQSTSICARGNTQGIKCTSLDALHRTKVLCDNRKKCRVIASTRMYGDPCRGVSKYLHITFKCVKGDEKKVSYQNRKLGCYYDRRRRAIPGKTTRHHPRRVVNECLARAVREGNDIFAVQNQRECRTQWSYRPTYNKYGKASYWRCRYGRGGRWANDVYKIVEAKGGNGGNEGGIPAPSKMCPSAKQNGFCVEWNGHDQNRGVRRLMYVNGNSAAVQKRCLQRCLAVEGATGCEVIWNQSNRGCYVHTYGVAGGNGVRNHACWVFEPCTDHSRQFSYLGCWRDGRRRALSVSLERTDRRLTGSYRSRREAIKKCYAVAKERRYHLFAIQHGGQCFASWGGKMYQRYGKSMSCRRGKGAGWANDVYQINPDYNPELPTTPVPITKHPVPVTALPGTNATLPGKVPNTFISASVSASRRTCAHFIGDRCIRWRTVGGGTKRASVTFTLPDVDRFGGCVSFKYRVHTFKTSTIVTFFVRGRIRIRGRSHFIYAKTVRAVSEGPYWQTAEMTIPPRASEGPFTIDIKVVLTGHRMTKLDIDNIALTNGKMCGVDVE